MSKSNHNYYNICTGSRYWEPVGDDGWCGRHRPRLIFDMTLLHGERRKCIGPREYLSREGIVRRKPRFPRYSWKSHGRNPPHDMKRYWNKQIRQQARRELCRNPEEPMLWPNKWLAGMYGWWL